MILRMNVDLSKQSSQKIIREILEFMVIWLRRHTSVNCLLNQLRLQYDMSEKGDAHVTAFSQPVVNYYKCQNMQCGQIPALPKAVDCVQDLDQWLNFL